MSDFVNAGDRDEMISAFVGVVTAKVQRDDQAVQRELGAIMRHQYDAAGGDVNVFGQRMSKQVEAGATIAWMLVMSLAPRLGLTEEEAWRQVAEANQLRPPATD